ncbi:hypothetical protein AB6A40_001666 [Gnathostoma spinigerum]|uniref:Kinase D-interacting substrate of 220 kDa-like SAM domain-containing protein n=1 Tax=Gnathostoma spinigerum TaxID=75299 RepID=A0ABD6EE36_9BILA
MRVDDVVKLIEKLDISDERIRMIAKSMREANLNGLVLSTCELKDVQRTLRLQLGDWTLVKLLINTLRRLEVTGKRTLSRGAVSSNTEKVTLQSIQEHKRLLTARSEVESDHQWLMESLSGMDLAEVNGDDAVVANVSQEASVHFNDGVASDADSTESMCGSRENLLEPCGRPISNANINREQMMRRAQADSVHSEQGSGFLDRLTTLSSNNEEQKTIVTRHIATGDKPPPVFDIFDQSSS